MRKKHQSQFTGYYDEFDQPIFLGDKLSSKWKYDVIVYQMDNGDYAGKLVCDETHSCKDIPYSISEGNDHVNQTAREKYEITEKSYEDWSYIVYLSQEELSLMEEKIIEQNHGYHNTKFSIKPYTLTEKEFNLINQYCEGMRNRKHRLTKCWLVSDWKEKETELDTIFIPQ